MVSARWFEEGVVIVRREGNGYRATDRPPRSPIVTPSQLYRTTVRRRPARELSNFAAAAGQNNRSTPTTPPVRPYTCRHAALRVHPPRPARTCPYGGRHPQGGDPPAGRGPLPGAHEDGD